MTPVVEQQRVVADSDQVVIVRVDPKSLPDEVRGVAEQVRAELPDMRVLIVACEDVKALPRVDKQRILEELGLD